MASFVVDVALVLGGIAGLWLGALQFVAGATRLARRLGIPGLVIGLTVVALGTSAPEFATSVVAVSRGRTNLSAGNVVGSCIVNALGVLGLAGVVRSLPAVAAAVEGTLWLLGITVVATALFWSRGVLSRIEGGVLVVLNVVDWVLDVVSVSVSLPLPFP